MKSQNLLVLFLLLVSTYSHLTTDNDPSDAHPITDNAHNDADIPDELKSDLRNNAKKAIDNLNHFGSGTASLALIKFELKNINNCLDQILANYQAARQRKGLAPTDQMLVIANKELSGLTEDSQSMDLDFLITTAPLTIIREIILGVYKIKLSNIDALSSDPDSVVTTMQESDAFLAAKNIFLYTPVENRILC